MDKKNDFESFLDNVAQEQEAATEPPAEAAAETLPAGPPDEFEGLIGRQHEEADELDPFAALLDGMIAQEGRSVDEDLGPKVPEVEEHQWEAKREMRYGEDSALVECQKCFRSMMVGRDETLGKAMARHKISENCGNQLVADIQDE